MMIKRLFIILSISLSAGLMMAQEPVSDRPQRTPEDEAIKQTVRLVRELDIKDSVRFDTIYKMHLKYARVRQKGLTRAQEMERMNAIYAELKRLLTEKSPSTGCEQDAAGERNTHRQSAQYARTAKSEPINKPANISPG